MLIHASIPAQSPALVARALATLLGGQAIPFPPWPGAFVAMAGDARGTTIEVYPADSVIAPGDGTSMARPLKTDQAAALSGFHLALATPRTQEQVTALARDLGWRAVRCSRGGRFDVIELWVENAVLIEVMTREMYARYVSNTRADIWRTGTASSGQTSKDAPLPGRAMHAR